MAKIDKLLTRIRNNPKNVSFEDLRTLLEAYGFSLLRVSGSHYIFERMVDGESITIVIPFRRGQINSHYVKRSAH